jgi:hypothetical protein
MRICYDEHIVSMPEIFRVRTTIDDAVATRRDGFCDAFFA